MHIFQSYWQEEVCAYNGLEWLNGLSSKGWVGQWLQLFEWQDTGHRTTHSSIHQS